MLIFLLSVFEFVLERFKVEFQRIIAKTSVFCVQESEVTR